MTMRELAKCEVQAVNGRLSNQFMDSMFFTDEVESRTPRIPAPAVLPRPPIVTPALDRDEIFIYTVDSDQYFDDPRI
jgi:hypothetical protein